jgi:RNA-directed DNA polymerase
MCYIKQWRRPRTRIRKLLELGSPKKQALGVGLSSKGPWRLAKTFGGQAGLTNAYLKEQGLVSVRELWIAFVITGKKFPTFSGLKLLNG